MLEWLINNMEDIYAELLNQKSKVQFDTNTVILLNILP